jgi:hypothetical protein
VVAALQEEHQPDGEGAPSGLLSLDHLLEAPHLHDFQFKTLSCYVLRANLIPAEYTRIPGTIMVMTDSTWRNYNVKENHWTREETADSTFRPAFVDFLVRDEQGQPVTLNDDNVAFTVFQDGRFFANDRQPQYDKSQSRITGELDPGEYQLQIGIRENGEHTRVKLVALSVSAGDSVRDTLIFHDLRRQWKKVPAAYRDFLREQLPDSVRNWVVLLGDYQNEPVQRLATRVRRNLKNAGFVWLGGTPTREKVAEYRTSEGYGEFLEAHPELKHRLLTFRFEAATGKWLYFEGIWDLLPD